MSFRSRSTSEPGRGHVESVVDRSDTTVDERVQAVLQPGDEETLDRLSRLAARVTRAPVALVSIVGSDRQYFKSCIGLPEPWRTWRETPLTHSFCQHVVRDEKPLVVRDAREHPALRENLAIRDLKVIAYLGMPLRTAPPERTVIGSFCVIDHEPREWEREEIETIEVLASSVMSELNWRHSARREELLLREMDHRVRNSLMTLHALVNMASRRHDTVEGFHQSISTRVQSMITMHDLLSGRDWSSITLRDLLEAIVPPDCMPYVRADGPKAPLDARMTTRLGMVFQELVSNSLKYGALRRPRRTPSNADESEMGSVAVNWVFEEMARSEDDAGHDPARILRVGWKESLAGAAAPLEAPTRTGVGTTVIEKIVERELEGAVRLTFHSRGLEVQLRLPWPERDDK
ncbi:MAG: sensor histidine kinase [Phycisphaerales bacterium]